MTKQARLLKILVQTVWIEMDDETGDIVEQVGGMVAVPAAEWPTFYDRHAEDFAALQKQVAAMALHPDRGVFLPGHEGCAVTPRTWMQSAGGEVP